MHGLLRLKATVNSYDWGKPAAESLVAKFGKVGSGLSVESDKNYSELWVGTHPNGTASLFAEDESLKKWLELHPSALSTSEVGNAGEGLCFLFKILSIGKALSIQAHPNKSRAEELFKERPDLYKDPNHKPEMACALTDFEALLGFESLDTIVRQAEATPELKALLCFEERGKRAWEGLLVAANSNEVKTRKDALKEFFSCVLSSDAQQVAIRVDELVTRVLQLQAKSLETKKPRVESPMDDVNALALRLHKDFPHDVGIFCAFIMCYRKLSPGEAVFLTSNEPHAYLSGECVEVMANSDNVIRAALTPKFKDLKELERMLTYNEPGAGAGWHPCQVLVGQQRDDHTSVFPPPDSEVREFQLERTVVRSGGEPYRLTPGSYASVLFVTEGAGKAEESGEVLQQGATFLLTAGASVSLTGDMVVYRVTKRGSIVD